MTHAVHRAMEPAATRLLARTARALAAEGVTADRLWLSRPSPLPPALVEALAHEVAPPDREPGYRVIEGALHGVEELDRTPPSWRVAKVPEGEAIDLAIVLLASVMGSVFGWANQQDGRLVHDIVPSRGQERRQVGASSSTRLAWHTEDAFHPHRADLLLLACVRSRDGVGTDVASVRRAEVSARQLRLLGRPGVVITPDDSYPETWRQDGAPPPGMATVWAADDGPCLRYDPSYTTVVDADGDFLAAYDALGHALDACGETIQASPGDVLLVDNDIAVHSRRPFRARYDGTDRWLKRTMIRLDRSRPAERGENGYGQELVEPRGDGR